MSCCNSKDCDSHQNSSFIFGLITGLVIAAIVAVVIYKNNRQDVFLKLKKQIEKFLSSFKKSETFQNLSKIADKVDINNSAKISKKHSKKIIIPVPVKSEPPKKEVVLPKNLIAQNSEIKSPVSKSKPRTFKK